MHFVYILYSETLSRYYTGYTASIEQRIYKHNKKHKGFTASVNDWTLVYGEEFKEKDKALKREKEIKRWKSVKMIEKLISAKG